MKIICVNCGVKNRSSKVKVKVDHRSYRRNFCICKKKAKKNSGLYGIQTLDLCDTGAVLYQYWANKPTGNRSLNLFINKPMKGWRRSYEYVKIIYVNCGVKNYMKVDHCSHRCNFCSCKKKGFFSRLSFCNCKSCVYNCNDLLSLFFTLQFTCMIFIFITSLIINCVFFVHKLLYVMEINKWNEMNNKMKSDRSLENKTFWLIRVTKNLHYTHSIISYFAWVGTFIQIFWNDADFLFCIIKQLE